MAFQDEACRLRNRVRLGKVKPSVLIGAACVAALVVIVVSIGVAQALATDGFVVTKGDETTTNESVSSAVAETLGDAAPAQVCVFVSGEVVHPDIYYLDEGVRVADAVTAAGGFTGEAATDALNLARTLIDGEQVAVPSRESAQTSQGAAVQGGAAVAASTDASSSAPSSAAGRVNINTADAGTLQTLNGVGEATAKKIVADREANGPFKTIEDLKRVSGIGDKKFENLRDSICV